MQSEVHRKLTTILAADAAGYSRAMDRDEVATLSALRAARAVFAKFIERHRGRIVNTAGDGLIAEFPSVVEAVQCAMEVQNELRDGSQGGQHALPFRIGIHLGDVMIDGSDLLGEGVNLAARLEAMAEPGGILISQQVFDQVHHKLSVGFEYIGEKRPKNFSEDVPVYRLSLGGAENRFEAADQKPQPRRRNDPKPAIARQTDLRSRVMQLAKSLGIIWCALFAVDVFTGDDFWAHWPGIAMAAIVAFKAAPLFASGWVSVQFARGCVIVAALAAVNLATWDGYPWVMWPAGAMITFGLLRHISFRSS